MKINVKYGSGILESMIGMLNKSKAIPLLLRTRFGIHTFGMKFPIDVVILNSTFHVMNIREGMEPNRIFFWSPIYFNVLELPDGFIKKHAISIGDTLELDVI